MWLSRLQVCKLENATLEAQALLDAQLLPTLIDYLVRLHNNLAIKNPYVYPRVGLPS
jgi:hypothetical protein